MKARTVDGANEDNTGSSPSSGPPQCRICFDGPDQELGRLIKPCLCKGSISVGLRVDRHQSKAAHSLSPSLLARSRQVLAEVENYLRLDERILGLPSVPLPLPFRKDSSVRARLQPRQVSSEPARVQRLIKLTLVQRSLPPSQRPYLPSLSTSLPSSPPHVSACSSKASPRTPISSRTTFTRLTPSKS